MTDTEIIDEYIDIVYERLCCAFDDQPLCTECVDSNSLIHRLRNIQTKLTRLEALELDKP